MNRIRAELQADYAYGLGLTGKNVGVAVVDSGVDWKHPDLKGRIAHIKSFGSLQDKTDHCGHGTHISGMIGGNGAASAGRYQGMAPGCHLVGLKVMDEKGNAKAIDVINALYWIMENGKQYRIRIVNISMGGKMKEEEARELLQAVEKVWKAGYVICTAAGNQGPEKGSITVPGNSRWSITVGSSDDHSPVLLDGKPIRDYSGRGPTESCICKPDVVAPGAHVMSCQARWRERGGSFYCSKSGTSMATPAVAGSLALLLEQRPWLSNREIKLHLAHCCVDQGQPQNQQGWGKLFLPFLLGRKFVIPENTGSHQQYTEKFQ